MSLLIKKVLEKLKELETKISSLESNTISKNNQVYYGDFNDLKDTGFYYADGSCSNTPTYGYSQFVYVIKRNDNYVAQQAIRCTPTTTGIQVSVRVCYNGTWTEWKEV